MNVPNSNAVDNPKSADPQEAAKTVSEMIDSLASELKLNIVNAANRGASFEEAERIVLEAILKTMKMASQLQGNADLGGTATKADVLQEGTEPTEEPEAETTPV